MICIGASREALAATIVVSMRIVVNMRKVRTANNNVCTKECIFFRYALNVELS